MVTKTVIINNSLGIHARPASMLAKETKKYEAKIKLVKNQREFDPGSILSIICMGAKFGDEIIIVADGNDEMLAAENMAELFDNNFGE